MSKKWQAKEKVIQKIIAGIKGRNFRIVEYIDANGKNENFKLEYNRTYEQITKMLECVEYEDYIYSVDNLDGKIKTDVLHVFKHGYNLVNAFGTLENNVCVYIKIGIIAKIEEEYILLVSFHKDEI